MAVLQEFKCPCCDGAVAFDSASQKMKCPYCDTEFELSVLQDYNERLQNQPGDDMQWQSAGTQWQQDETANMWVYTCNACGGEIVGDATTGATQCPFCGNPAVMTGQFAGALKPDLVIPFKLDKKAAMAALKNHYKGKVLLPKVFKDENRIREVKGLYVPFWLFDADADGFVRYKATKVRLWSDSRYNYKETSYYDIVRAGALGFADVPVDASQKMEDALMESIEPYDLSQAVDFKTAYLAGFFADKYDVDAEIGVQRANARIRSTVEATFSSTVRGYDTVRTVSSNIHLSGGRVKYALFPVWILNTQWKGKNYCFAMNGQTGKLVGDLPMDKGAFWAWLLGVSAIATVLIFLLSYLICFL